MLKERTGITDVDQAENGMVEDAKRLYGEFKASLFIISLQAVAHCCSRQATEYNLAETCQYRFRMFVHMSSQLPIAHELTYSNLLRLSYGFSSLIRDHRVGQLPSLEPSLSIASTEN